MAGEHDADFIDGLCRSLADLADTGVCDRDATEVEDEDGLVPESGDLGIVD